MKVIHLSTSDSGGAGRAAFRIHKSLLEIGVNSKMWVDISNTGEKTVTSPKGKINKTLAFMRRYTRIPFLKLLKTKNPVLHSPATFPSSWIKKINDSNADIVNLHWVQHEMLSISDIAKIKKPLVWTLHDMWAFCGAEHIAWDNRWQNGYTKYNRPSHERGFDINRWTWSRKIKYWKKSFQIITPSSWLTECVQKSKLMNTWPSLTIPNSIDTEFWKPINKNLARDKLNLPEKDLILAFGSSNSNYEHHKGFDLLSQALKKIKNEKKINIQLFIFGQSKSQKDLSLELPARYAGYLDDINLKTLYSAVDAVVVPSRQESFGQIASEASACETPVIAFNTGGLRDIIKHRVTGYLAEKFSIEDLANGIQWVLQNTDIELLGNNARNQVKNNFDSKIVAKKYLDIYYQNL